MGSINISHYWGKQSQLRMSSYNKYQEQMDQIHNSTCIFCHTKMSEIGYYKKCEICDITYYVTSLQQCFPSVLTINFENICFNICEDKFRVRTGNLILNERGGRWHNLPSFKINFDKEKLFNKIKKLSLFI